MTVMPYQRFYGELFSPVILGWVKLEVTVGVMIAGCSCSVRCVWRFRVGQALHMSMSLLLGILKLLWALSVCGYRDVLIMFLFNNMMLKLFNARWVLDID